MLRTLGSSQQARTRLESKPPTCPPSPVGYGNDSKSVGTQTPTDPFGIAEIIGSPVEDDSHGAVVCEESAELVVYGVLVSCDHDKPARKGLTTASRLS